MEIRDGNENGDGRGGDRLGLRHRMRRIPAWALRAQAAEAARRARRQLPLLIGLLAILGVAYAYRRELFGVDRPIRLATAAVLVLLGWSVARNVARALQPRLTRGLDVGTAGVAGFAIQLGLLAAAALVSLRLAGIPPATLAAGAGFTAIVLGLAAQQTIGNVFAGIVLLAARPFQVGDRVQATPSDPRDGGRLAREVLEAVASFAPRDAAAAPRP